MPNLKILMLIVLTACSSHHNSHETLGKFHPAKDLFLAHFDCKTDVDDLHSVAAVATILADPRFDNVKYHAVAGAYGTQVGLYVPANELFAMAFGRHWSDAHTDYSNALAEVTEIATNTLQRGGDIWIAEAGQSDFSADLARRIQSDLPLIDTAERIHLVQHSDWNEEVTTPDKLHFVKKMTDYHKIADGNVVGNGTPGFRCETMPEWRRYITDPHLVKVWQLALDLAQKYNGAQQRYHNAAIASGGLDFSDVAESCWIFGFANLSDATAFFREFATIQQDHALKRR